MVRVLRLDCQGRKDLLGIGIGEQEGSKFWLKVLTDLKNRGENRMSAVASQLSTSNEAAFQNLLAQIPLIQQKEVPVEPQLWPLALSSIYDSFTRKTPNPEILTWTQEILVIWQKSLAGADLRGADLTGADLSEANLAGATASETKKALLTRPQLNFR